jgi:cell filamentation protein
MFSLAVRLPTQESKGEPVTKSRRKAMPPGVKYRVSGREAFQPGSKGKVLSNLLGITSVRAMEEAELAAAIEAEHTLIGLYDEQHTFNRRDINRIHRLFLGKIYAWAGITRDVNMSKGGFTFAGANVIPQLMNDLERGVLAQHTPCRGATIEEIAEHIAVVHVEVLLIHPYRDGNGRTARLLATLMAYQAGMPGIDFGFIGSRGKEFERYVAAVQAGLNNDYAPMTAIVLRALNRALRRSRSRER